MIYKNLNKRLMSLFTWGAVPSSLGTNLNNYDVNIKIPKNIESFEELKPLKVEMKKNTGILTEDGKLITFGPNKYGELGHEHKTSQNLPKEINYFMKNNIKIVDFSLGTHHSLALDSNGKVYAWGLGNNFNLLDKNLLQDSLNTIGDIGISNTDVPKEVSILNGKVKKLFAGDTFSLALMDNDDLYHWGYGRNGVIGFNHPSDYEIPSYINDKDYFFKPQLVLELKNILQKQKTTIKDMKVYEHSVMILLENGELLTWGEDRHGQLATGRTILVKTYFEVLKPTFVNKTYEGKINQFDLSRDVLIVMNNQNKVYYSGIDKKMSLTEVKLPKNKIAKSVHACDGSFIIITKDNEILSSQNFLESDKYYGKYNLYKIDSSIFNNKNILSIGGHFDNRYVLTN